MRVLSVEGARVIVERVAMRVLMGVTLLGSETGSTASAKETIPS